MKQEFQDRIDDYLLGRMSEAEHDAIERDLLTNAELQEQLVDTKLIMGAIKSRNEKLVKMAQWQDKYDRQEIHVAAAGRNTVRKFTFWASGIAAVLIAGFFVINTLRTNDSYGNGGMTDYNSYFELASSARDGNGMLSHIQELCRQDSFYVALAEIEKAERNLDNEIDGISKGSYSSEQKEYRKMQVQAFREDLQWLKVWALLESGQKEKALLLLDQIRNSEGEYQDKAEKLYKLETKKTN